MVDEGLRAAAPAVTLDRRLNDLLFVSPRGLQENAPELTGMGEVLLFLISEWPQWLERRVETVRFLDADTVARDVSVDFILPIVPTFLTREGKAVTFVPLGTLLKRELVNFSLRDEEGRPMPLISARQNGPLAAATLLAGARMWVGAVKDLPGPVPLTVVEDLWAIGTSDADQAIARWSRLGISRGEETESPWRREMLATGRFMALARDLARNFMVLTPIVVEPRRRVIKLSYQEVTGIPRVKVGRRPFIDRKRKAKKPRRSYPEGVGMITAKAWKSQDVLSGNGDSETPVDRTPLPGVEVKLDGPDPCTMRTGVDGSAVVQAPLGNYTVSCTGPEGAFLVSHPPHCELTSPGEEVTLSIDFNAGPTFTDQTPAESRLTVRSKIMRALAISPKPIEISLPSIGQCHSYHLQFETADGFHIVAAKIRYAISVTSLGSTPSVNELSPQLTPLQQRVGLYTSGVAPNRVAAATFSVRPRPSMIVRAAFLASVLGWLVLLISFVARESLTVNPGPWVALLLIVPAGLSAYVGRTRENLFATEVLIGLRGMALLNALWSFAAAVTVVLSRHLTVGGAEPEAQSIGGESGTTRWILAALLVGNTASVIALFLAWRRSHNPPEFRAPNS